MKMKKFKWLIALPLTTFALPLIAASCGTIKLLDEDSKDQGKPKEINPENPREILERNDESSEAKALFKLTLENFVKGLNAENEEKYKEFIEVIKKMDKNADAKKIFDYYNSEKDKLVSIIKESSSAKKFENKLDTIKSFEDIYKIRENFRTFEKRNNELTTFLEINNLSKDYEEQLQNAATLESLDKIKKEAKESITLENVNADEKRFTFSIKNRELIKDEEIQVIVYITSENGDRKYISVPKNKTKITENTKVYKAWYHIKKGVAKKFKVHLLGAKVTNADGEKYYWVPGFEKYVEYLTSENKKSFKLQEEDEKSLKYVITL
ncbi:hypothetical protein [Mycoplasma phocoeninasale]|uniref:hypothetical protein n=1 Tax=Mycoplasma phocoeninasale TaxID=2726117 RepID=UPI001967AAB3|nr:hypothetical protein [Mycoplasma phocoeninasale]MBN0970461.1 hypothetical protein [Mycoplasma phocoeninasale]